MSRIIIPVLLFAGCICACTSPEIRSGKQLNTNRLKLTVHSKYILGMGYGSIFECKVKSVEKGSMKEGEVFDLVTVKQRYEAYLLKHPTCVVTFKKIAMHEEYTYPTTDGFIDRNKNNWKVVSMK